MQPHACGESALPFVNGPYALADVLHLGKVLTCGIAVIHLNRGSLMLIGCPPSAKPILRLLFQDSHLHPFRNTLGRHATPRYLSAKANATGKKNVIVSPRHVLVVVPVRVVSSGCSCGDGKGDDRRSSPRR